MVEKICSRAVAHIPGANMKGFLVTILSEAKRQQIQLSEPGGRVLDLQWSERWNGQKLFSVSGMGFGQQPIVWRGATFPEISGHFVSEGECG